VESFRPRPFFEPSRGECGQQEPEAFLLKAREAAQRLAISESCLYRLTASGEIPCVRVGKLVRYSVETLRNWIKARESCEPAPLPLNPQPRRPAVQPDQAKVPRASSKHRSPSRKKPVPAPEPSAVRGSAKTVIQRSRSDIESTEQSSRFSQFVKSMGISPSKLPPLTNGELMKIARVGLIQWHGWQYLGKALPDEALERLTHHLQWLASSPRPR
jgi:excisionase family DNA binding protein